MLASKWLVSASLKGDRFAQVGLQTLSEIDPSVLGDFGTQFKLFEKTAMHGDQYSQALISYAYRIEQGGWKPNLHLSLEWAKRAVEQGNATGQKMALKQLALHYVQEKIMVKDSERALLLYMKMGNFKEETLSDTIAKTGIKPVYAPQTIEVAKAFYEKIAKEGSGLASSMLGFGYQYGVFGNPDFITAIQHYIRAATAKAPNFSGIADLWDCFQQTEPKDLAAAKITVFNIIECGMLCLSDKEPIEEDQKAIGEDRNNVLCVLNHIFSSHYCVPYVVEDPKEKSLTLDPKRKLLELEKMAKEEFERWFCLPSTVGDPRDARLERKLIFEKRQEANRAATNAGKSVSENDQGKAVGNTLVPPVQRTRAKSGDQFQNPMLTMYNMNQHYLKHRDCLRSVVSICQTVMQARGPVRLVAEYVVETENPFQRPSVIDLAGTAVLKRKASK